MGIPAAEQFLSSHRSAGRECSLLSTTIFKDPKIPLIPEILATCSWDTSRSLGDTKRLAKDTVYHRYKCTSPLQLVSLDITTPCLISLAVQLGAPAVDLEALISE